MLSCHDLEAFMSIDDALTQSAERGTESSKHRPAWEYDDADLEDGSDAD